VLSWTLFAIYNHVTKFYGQAKSTYQATPIIRTHTRNKESLFQQILDSIKSTYSWIEV
ncbi:uncharacterized protein METZ01_LOCUS487514, partial [marine metagenome]